MRLELRKVVGDKTVCVEFQARQPTPEEEPEEGEEEKSEEQREEEDQMMGGDNYCDFNVWIYKTGQNKGILFDCTTMDTEVGLQRLLLARRLA